MTTSTTSARTGLEHLTGTYDIDAAHSSLGFAARHAMVTTVRGRFGDFAGTLEIDGTDPSRSRAEVTVVLASIDSGNADRDAHLRSPDFFDVGTHPTMTFRSTRAAAGDDTGEYRIWGDLTIKDVTREVELRLDYTGTAVDPWGKQRIGFEGTATINRKDWGLTWNVALEAGGILVSDKVALRLDIAAVRRDPA